MQSAFIEKLDLCAHLLSCTGLLLGEKNARFLNLRFLEQHVVMETSCCNVGYKKQPLGVYTNVSQGCLWYVASLCMFGCHSLWLPKPSHCQEFMEMFKQFGRLSASEFLVYVITDVGKSSIQFISVRIKLLQVNSEELRFQGQRLKTRKGTNVCAGY